MTQLEMPYMAPAACSREANDRAAESKHTQRERILIYIEGCGTFGATDNELQEALGLAGNTVRPRRGELAVMGKIAPSGAKRRNEAGNNCAVWVAAVNHV